MMQAIRIFGAREDDLVGDKRVGDDEDVEEGFYVYDEHGWHVEVFPDFLERMVWNVLVGMWLA